MTTPSKTPITDAFFNRKPKPGDRPFLTEVRERLESLEEAAQGLRDALERMRDSARPNSTEHPAMFAAWLNAAKELAQAQAELEKLRNTFSPQPPKTQNHSK